jgi:hypothetical protein
MRARLSWLCLLDLGFGAEAVPAVIRETVRIVDGFTPGRLVAELPNPDAPVAAGLRELLR